MRDREASEREFLEGLRPEDQEDQFLDEFDALLAPILAEHEHCLDCAEDPMRDHNGPRR